MGGRLQDQLNSAEGLLNFALSEFDLLEVEERLAMSVGPSDVALDAAFVLRDAAESLSIDAGEAIDRDRYRIVASRLEWVGDVLPPDRSRILEASPDVVE